MKLKENLLLLGGLVFLAIFISLSLFSFSVDESESEREVFEEAVVTRVIDGDTFEIDSGEHVRFICVDAPERGMKGAEEASEFLTELIENKTVLLERDVSERDAYGRLLRYVFMDDVFVNRLLVRKNYATVFRYGNDTQRCDEIAE